MGWEGLLVIAVTLALPSVRFLAGFLCRCLRHTLGFCRRALGRAVFVYFGGRIACFSHDFEFAVALGADGGADTLDALLNGAGCWFVEEFGCFCRLFSGERIAIVGKDREDGKRGGEGDGGGTYASFRRFS